MSVISKRFADELTEKEMRDAYLEAQTRMKVAQQIRALRVQRDLSQSQLGDVLGKPQGNIARLEDREVARYTLTTLFELASAFDVGLVVEFVSYPEFLERTGDLSPDGLKVPSFDRAQLTALTTDAPEARVPEALPIDQVVWSTNYANMLDHLPTTAIALPLLQSAFDRPFKILTMNFGDSPNPSPLQAALEQSNKERDAARTECKRVLAENANLKRQLAITSAMLEVNQLTGGWKEDMQEFDAGVIVMGQGRRFPAGRYNS